ncbi:MAG: zinc metallopeptidase [Oscillospiraceae bacterium]|nr:zinc metallopeptidase [Oscillospiraceae bacterium]
MQFFFTPMFFFFFPQDIYFFVLVIPAMIICGIASARVQSTFARFSKIHNRRGLTGAQVARQILDENRLYDVQIKLVKGNLTDHYDPRTKVVALSQSVHDSTSVAALGVAAHEVGHAIQHAENYAPLKARSSLVRVTGIASSFSMIIIIIGFLMFESALGFPIIMIGAALFSTIVIFQLVTLPVEFNASTRAMAALRAGRFLDESEETGARKVLSAAAMTYVAALLLSIMQLVRILLIANRRR